MFARFDNVNDIKIRDIPRQLIINLYEEQMQYSHHNCISIGTSMTYSTRYVYKHMRLISTTMLVMANTMNIISWSYWVQIPFMKWYKEERAMQL